jgi:hypothetical protein
MSSFGQVYNRTTVLRQRVQALLSQLAELQDLQDQVLKAEQRTIGTRCLSRIGVAGRAASTRTRRLPWCRIAADLGLQFPEIDEDVSLAS